MGLGGAEGRRKTTKDVNLNDNEIAEDARRQARDAKACALHLQDLVRFHGETHAGRPRNLGRVIVKTPIALVS